MKLDKVYFYWVNRQQDSFEWFSQLLAKLEKESKLFLRASGLCPEDQNVQFQIRIQLSKRKS